MNISGSSNRLRISCPIISNLTTRSISTRPTSTENKLKPKCLRGACLVPSWPSSHHFPLAPVNNKLLIILSLVWTLVHAKDSSAYCTSVIFMDKMWFCHPRPNSENRPVIIYGIKQCAVKEQLINVIDSEAIRGGSWSSCTHEHDALYRFQCHA